ncbi:MAG: 50S ribosomal protein L28 [Candidatus Eisenbacteria bacterium]|nr:50S ribosomal protein L28 [Candidatus Eisenbacteria bacterium]
MAKCFVCGKLRMAGQNVSHANNITKRTFNINIQTVRALVDGRAKQVKVCTRCIRSNKITKAVRGTRKAVSSAA